MAKKKGVIAQSLDNSMKEAGAASVMSGVGDSFVSPFAIAMNANPLQISLLSSIANLLAPWFQIHANNLMKTRSRKLIVTKAVLIHALAWIPFILIPFIFKGDLLRTWSVVVFYAILATIAGFAGPVWNSWMGDLVKEEKRGAYFSKRTKIASLVILITSLFAAWFLNKAKITDKSFLGVEYVLAAFSILFFIAFIARLVSRYYLTRQYEPRFRYDPKSYFSIKDFMKRLRDSNLGIYVLYGSILRISVNIAGPFFSIYMLRELGFSYPEYIAMTIASSLATIAVLPLWGRLTDRYGSVKVMIISGIMLSFIPILWVFSTNWYYLLFVNLFGGASWAGFNLGGSNFIYDVVPRKKRSFAFTYNNIIVGFGVFVGATTGGLIATYIHIENVFIFLFFLSGFFRLATTLFFVFKLREERNVEEKPVIEIFSKDVLGNIFVHVSNLIPRKQAIKDALNVNKIKVDEKRENLKKKILTFNRKYSGKKEKKFKI